MKQVLKPEVLQKVKDDEVLIFDIATFVGKKFRTVYQWVLSNGEQLQAPAVLQMIKSRHGYKSNSELIGQDQQAAA